MSAHSLLADLCFFFLLVGKNQSATIHTPLDSVLTPFSPQMGDPIRALQAKEIISVIKRDNLIAKTASVGDYLYSSLAQLSESAHGGKFIQNLRGENSGTFIAFDSDTPESRDKFVNSMRQIGVNMGGCGERAVRLRPMLVFEQKHADIFLEKVEETLKSL